MLRPTNPESPIYPFLRRFLARMDVPVGEGADAPPDWGAAAALLARYRLRPMAYWLLRGSGREAGPDLPAVLESAFFAAALRYERLAAALEEIGAAFWRRGIPGIVLKGMAVAGRLYPEPACRPMEDLDLLVRPTDAAAGGRTLVDLGYSDLSFGPEDFRHPGNGVTVDLHVGLLNATRLPIRRLAWQPDPEGLWSRSRPLDLAGGRLRLLDPRDHLAYLCHHFWLHHGLRRPLNMVDICLELEHTRALPADGPAPPPGPASRGLWYALGACRDRLGLDLPGPLSPPSGAGPLERLVQRYARRGRLPEAMRYAYLWFALPPASRWRLLPALAGGAWRQVARPTPVPWER